MKDNTTKNHILTFEMIEQTYNEVLENPQSYDNKFKKLVFSRYINFVKNIFFFKEKKISKKKILDISKGLFNQKYSVFKKYNIVKLEKKNFSEKAKTNDDSHLINSSSPNLLKDSDEDKKIPDFISFDILSAKKIYQKEDVKKEETISKNYKLKNGTKNILIKKEISKNFDNRMEKEFQKIIEKSIEDKSDIKSQKIINFEKKIDLKSELSLKIKIEEDISLKLNSNFKKLNPIINRQKKIEKRSPINEFEQNFQTFNNNLGLKKLNFIQNSKKIQPHFNFNLENNFQNTENIFFKKNNLEENKKNNLENRKNNFENQKKNFFKKKHNIYTILEKIWFGKAKTVKMNDLLKLENYQYLILVSLIKRKFGVELEKNNFFISLKQLQNLDHRTNLKRDDEKIKFIFNKFLKMIKSTNSKQKNFYKFFYKKYLKKNLDEKTYKKNFLISNKKKIIGKKFNYLFIKIFLSNRKLKNLFIDFTYLLKKDFKNIIKEKFFNLLDEFENLFEKDYKKFINRTNMMENFEYSFRLPWTIPEINEAIELHTILAKIQFNIK